MAKTQKIINTYNYDVDVFKTNMIYYSRFVIINNTKITKYCNRLKILIY